MSAEALPITLQLFVSWTGNGKQRGMLAHCPRSISPSLALKWGLYLDGGEGGEIVGRQAAVMVRGPGQFQMNMPGLFLHVRT